jgi:hypothetical protein
MYISLYYNASRAFTQASGKDALCACSVSLCEILGFFLAHTCNTAMY